MINHINYTDLTFSFTMQGTFAGGTGRFTGRAGPSRGRALGNIYSRGLKRASLGGFGQFTEIITETQTLPMGKNEEGSNAKARATPERATSRVAA